jgi:hypothetical protein
MRLSEAIGQYYTTSGVRRKDTYVEGSYLWHRAYVQRKAENTLSLDRYNPPLLLSVDR